MDNAKPRLLVWTALAAVALTWLTMATPPHAFVTGDSGVKLIAAFNAIRHPTDPFRIDLPVIGSRRVPYVEHFFQLHGDHAHALQSPVFPVVSALPIAAFGLRGAYLLPIASFLLMLPLLNVIRRQTVPMVPIDVLAALTLLASPMFFYALEFWEHAPAIASVTAATALLVAFSRGGGFSAWTTALAGVLCGLAVLLRPEAVWYGAGLAFLCRRRGLVAFGLGAAVLLLPFMLANLLHSGHVAGPHAAANLAPLWDEWLGRRAQRVQLWLLPGGLPFVAAVVIVGMAWAGPFAHADLRRRQAIALIGGAAIALLGTGAVLPRESLWGGWPAASLLLVPFAGTIHTRRLWALALVVVGGVLLTSTHDGGAQWGPRFLLIATAPLLLLAACAASDAIGIGGLRPIRVALVAVILVSGIWTTRAAYRDLRGTKQYYARIADTAAAVAPPGGYLLSNLWWFDQIAASLHASRTFLYAADAPAATAILRELAAADLDEVTVAWTRNAAEGAEQLGSAMSATCYRIGDVREIAERELTFARATCASAGTGAAGASEGFTSRRVR